MAHTLIWIKIKTSNYNEFNEDTMGPNVSVPPLLVFATLPSFPAPSTTNQNKMERLTVLDLARVKMKNIVVQKRLRTILRWKIHPAKTYLIRPGDDVPVQRKKSKSWYEQFNITKRSDKIISLTCEQKLNPFSIASILAVAPAVRNTDMKHDMDREEWQYLTNQNKAQLPSEILRESDPGYTSKAGCKASEQEIPGIIDRVAFKFGKINQIQQKVNVLGRRFILAIKKPGTPAKRYEAQLVV